MKPKVKKSFAHKHGSKSDVFRNVTPEQLGHDQQINPTPEGGSPLINPGEAGHPLGQSMPYPEGEDNY
jgi:hypothetical protein